MRVLHLVKTSVGATWALRQMRQLVEHDVDVHVALPAGGPLVPKYQAAGITTHPLQLDPPLRRPWTWPALFGRLRNLVEQIDPAIIHSHFVATTLTMRLALGRAHPVPRIFQVPGPLHLEHTFFRCVEQLSSGSSDYWIGSCNWTCERYRQSGVAPDRVFLSYYGLDLDTFVCHERGKLRRELNVDAGTKLVGMVAYMYAPKRLLGQTRGLKGHEDLIDAAAYALKSEPNIICVFIGGAWNGASDYENRVRAYARQRLGDRAIFLGTRHDVAELYPDLDVVVHPSHSENVGGAAESLLLAVPTITTNVGGFPDLVRQDQTGWLVQPRAPRELAAAIVHSLREPAKAQRMSRSGQQLARKLFDATHTGSQIREIYQQILARHHEANERPSGSTV